MTLTGKQLLGQEQVLGNDSHIYGKNPKTGEKLLPAYPGASLDQVNTACELAEEAFDTYRGLSNEDRALFLETCAEEIMALGDALIDRAMSETGLPRPRIEGERGRTINQLKLFAEVVRTGNYLDIRIDPSLPDRQPLPRSDLRLQKIALGPVAIFGASNFPLAFSTAGGDTASALAAGCPVIVKAHSAHPGTAEFVGCAIQRAVAKCNLPSGVFSQIYGSGNSIGTELVKHPSIKAVGFTGSRDGGEALMKIAQNRPVPIPVYAEMSASNPVFLMPHALQERSEEIALAFVASLNLGAGQFCTSPGIVFAHKSEGLDHFIKVAKQAVSDIIPQTMLTEGIHKAYIEGVEQLCNQSKVSKVAQSKSSDNINDCETKLFTVAAEEFFKNKILHEEIFGATSLIVICETAQEYLKAAEHLEGQLTATIQCDPEDLELSSDLIPILERKVGRILCNGFPTGVEVCHAMVHGGPYPATSDSRSTSVGSSAIDRFIRPVCYQDFPQALLPEKLRDPSSK